MYQLACVVGARKVKEEGESAARSTREGKERKRSLFLAPLARVPDSPSSFLVPAIQVMY